MHDKTAIAASVITPVSGALYDNAMLYGGRLRVCAFGRFYDSLKREEDWTFSNLRTPEDARDKDSSLSRNLPRIAEEMRLRELLVPSPADFNARICWERELSVRIPFNRHFTVRRGVNADGCRLKPGQAYALSAAGCAMLAAFYPHHPDADEKVLVTGAHAGFRSLIDEQEALCGMPSRKPQSVVENILASLGAVGDRKYRRKRVGVLIILPIPSSEFKYPLDHPEWGEKNKKRRSYLLDRYGKSCLPGEEKDGRIELHEIITLQLTELGVPLENIGLIRTRDVFFKTGMPNKGEVWYSTRGAFPDRRNLLVLQHQRISIPPP